MNDDCIKLTTYSGEAGGSSAADKLLGVYADHRLAASVLLRGSEGFGRLHRLRTERLEVLMYDLPLVSIVVDTRKRIEPILEIALRTARRGLVTLEPARLLSGQIDPIEPTEQHSDATRLTIYIGRQQRSPDAPTFAAVCDLLYRHGIACASLLHGIDGTSRDSRDRSRVFGRNTNVPTMIIALGAGDRIARVLPELGRFLHKPLLTLERVRVCKRDGQLIARPDTLPGHDEHGLELCQKLTIYSSVSATHNGHNLHSEIVRRLLASDAAGATTVRASRGFYGDQPLHAKKLFQLRSDVPAITTVIDMPQEIAPSFEIIDELTADHGLVTSETVAAMRAATDSPPRAGLRLALHNF